MGATQLSGTQVRDGSLKDSDFASDAAISRSKLALIASLVLKSSFVDDDYFEVGDSAASDASKKLSGSALKSTLKTYFDSLYNNYSHPTGDGNLHVPANSTTNSGKVLTSGATAGTYTWETPTGGSGGAVSTDTIWDAVGDLVIGNGSDSAVRLAKGAQGKVLTAGATTLSWETPVAASATKLDDFTAPDDNTDLNATTTVHGLLLKATAPASGLVNFVGIANAETSYTCKALFDATAPTTQAFSDSASVGTALVAARRDHKHAMMAAPTSVSGSSGSCTGNAATSSSCSGSAAQLNGISSTQIFNNMGNNHSTYNAGFNSPTDFGPRFIQSNTDGPGTDTQYYNIGLGLGNDYAYSSYACQLVIPRNMVTPYLHVRRREGGTWGSWNKISAGYSDSSGSAATAARCNGNFYIDQHYGYGIIGAYNSTIFQGVFAMGDAYKLTAGGGISNLYGMCWSHPNAGGIAGNLDSHGMIVAINGGFGSCMSYSIVASSNVTAYSDERLKTNWKSLPDDFISKLSKVRNGTYDRIDGEKLRQVGVSAQSLQTLMPEAVIEAKDKIKTLGVVYGNAAMASSVELAKAVVKLQKEVKYLKSKVKELIK